MVYIGMGMSKLTYLYDRVPTDSDYTKNTVSVLETYILIVILLSTSLTVHIYGNFQEYGLHEGEVARKVNSVCWWYGIVDDHHYSKD